MMKEKQVKKLAKAAGTTGDSYILLTWPIAFISC